MLVLILMCEASVEFNLETHRQGLLTNIATPSLVEQTLIKISIHLTSNDALKTLINKIIIIIISETTLCVTDVNLGNKMSFSQACLHIYCPSRTAIKKGMSRVAKKDFYT